MCDSIVIPDDNSVIPAKAGIQPFLESCTIVSSGQLAGNIHSLVLEAPAVAAAVRPGQFVHLRLPALEGHILRRPFSVFCADVAAGTIRIDYQVVGEGSAHMTTLTPGTQLDLKGPRGTGWQIPGEAATRQRDVHVGAPTEAATKPTGSTHPGYNNTDCDKVNVPQSCPQHPLLVTGGIGSAPLYMLAKTLCDGSLFPSPGGVDAPQGADGVVSRGCDPIVIMGAQTASMLVHRTAYEQLLDPARLHITTDDGTAGQKGFTTTALQDLLAAGTPIDFIATCGPEPMLRIIANIAAEHNIPCQVSLERRMACGIGACLSCVVKTKQGQKRACLEGPVFNASDIIW
jgi:dihydroorotate dehydrogenase electron transfer subunit